MCDEGSEIGIDESKMGTKESRNDMRSRYSAVLVLMWAVRGLLGAESSAIYGLLRPLGFPYRFEGSGVFRGLGFYWCLRCGFMLLLGSIDIFEDPCTSDV